MFTSLDLTQEKKIVWLYDLNDYPWLRETFAHFPKRDRITDAVISVHKKYGNEKIVGYAQLEDNAPPDRKGKTPFKRRIFVLRDGDYEAYKDHFSFPTEAINPLTVQPRQKGLPPRKTQ
ncbi:hypothetical protein H6G41_32415 [Tolypothrix sp. FACHB-123]|uniref:DUF6009 family protein n=1 Tax=Tolypothrix sp. FACHB-123 TaxID=2692868 RepID=UPI001687CA22|nr:DUF6009 family protein [Tolypothrix sp. FACHB-123]MBD2359236.1 hypothetical protein [Tolypothrix sp. FACHB-123]